MSYDHRLGNHDLIFALPLPEVSSQVLGEMCWVQAFPPSLLLVLHKLSLRRPSKSSNTYTIEQCSNEDLRWCDVTDPYLDPPLPTKTAQLCPSHMPAPSGVRDCYRCVAWNMHATTTCLTRSSNGRLSSSSEPVQRWILYAPHRLGPSNASSLRRRPRTNKLQCCQCPSPVASCHRTGIQVYRTQLAK